MCTYCMIGDWQFRHNPPWNPPFPSPLIPLPINPIPIQPWDAQKLIEFMDILRRVKELEDRLSCPCEPNKADYLTILKDRIKALERKAAEHGG
jgi:hypothetical protein